MAHVLDCKIKLMLFALQFDIKKIKKLKHKQTYRVLNIINIQFMIPENIRHKFHESSTE